MKVNEHPHIVCIDVDKTLVGPNNKFPFSLEEIEIKNPYSGTILKYKAYKKNIELLKQYNGRGYYIRVWSAGGVLWAKAVVEALNLTQYVHDVETKPVKYVDDLDGSEILGPRVYIDE